MNLEYIDVILIFCYFRCIDILYFRHHWVKVVTSPFTRKIRHKVFLSLDSVGILGKKKTRVRSHKNTHHTCIHIQEIKTSVWRLLYAFSIAY